MNPDTDLFGHPVVVDQKVNKSEPRGYPAKPGSGPRGETCGSCQNCVRRGGASRTYLKCLVVRFRWTNGPGTDIRARSPACHYWTKAT